MVVKGSGGERYTLNSKKKRAYPTYTNYLIGNGNYIARIFTRTHRKNSVENEVTLAVKNGSYYGEERPLNTLYIGKKFVGFLYEGSGDLSEFNQSTDETKSMETEIEPILSQNKEYDDKYIYGTQIVVAVVMALIGRIAIYPILGDFVKEHQYSSIINTLHYLDYKGIPAIIMGFIFQILDYERFKKYTKNIIVNGLIAMLFNLLGIVMWTFAVLLVMVIIQGAINFIMEYLVWIVFFAVVIICVKDKLR